MKKILSSLAVIALTVGIVSGSAYALFTDTATISGITLAAGNADIQISGESETGTYADNWVFPSEFNTALSGLYPGFEDVAFVWVKNVSASDIELDLNGRITSASGNWNALKDVIQIKVQADDANGPDTGWKTLNQWNASSGIHFPGDDVAPDSYRKFRIYVRVPSSAGNEIAGLSVTDINFVITATQAN